MRILGLVLVLPVLVAACGSDTPKCADQECACVGNDCVAPVDPCDASPCANGAACTSAGDTFTCACAAGWEGATCSTNINECATNPCQHGGTCTDGLAAFTCACSAGYSGATCGTVVPIALWHLDGDTLDASGNGFHGVGAALVAIDGWARQAYAFDAADAQVAAPFIDLRNQSFTVEAWVDALGSVGGPIFTQCENASDGHCLRLQVIAGKATLDFGGDVLTGEAAVGSSWTHLAWVYDATSGTQRIYVDGKLDTEEAGHTAYLGASGSTLLGGNAEGGYFPGTIDEVRLYRAARTAAEIAFDAQTVVLYDFASGVAHDASTNALDGTLSAGVTSGPGASGEALYFDAAANGGAGAYVTTPGLAMFGIADAPFTLELRVKASAAAGATLLQGSDDSGWCVPFVGLNADGKPAAQVFNGATVDSIVAPDALTPGTWTRITETYRADLGLRIYVDGALVAVNPSASISSPTGSSGGALFSGGMPSACATDAVVAAPFAGAIDDLRVDHVARTSDEVAAAQNFDHACTFIEAEHPEATTTARDVALCGASYTPADMQTACNAGWHVCLASEWRARVWPPGFDPTTDEAPAIQGPLSSWGAPQARRCEGYFWEADRPARDRVWNENVCTNPEYNPWNNGKYLYADDGVTILQGDGGCCGWDADFGDPTDGTDAMAVYCCKT